MFIEELRKGDKQNRKADWLLHPY